MEYFVLYVTGAFEETVLGARLDSALRKFGDYHIYVSLILPMSCFRDILYGSDIGIILFKLKQK